jgi:hypothetical protein
MLSPYVLLLDSSPFELVGVFAHFFADMVAPLDEFCVDVCFLRRLCTLYVSSRIFVLIQLYH